MISLPPPLPPLRFSTIAPGRVPDLTPALFKPMNRSIGGITADITIEEQERDELTITEHPVEQGAPIADHAFKRPSEVTIRAAWTAQKHNLDSVIGTYNVLLSWQAALNPFQLFTGKRVYNDMLISSIAVTTDQSSEYILMATITCRQIIRVSTHVVETAGVANTENASGAPQADGTTDTGTKSPTGHSTDKGTGALVAKTADGYKEAGKTPSIPGDVAYMAVFEIPLQPFNETFQTVINGISYGIRTLWNEPAQCWIIDIYDVNDVPILTGTPLITGADLLAQYHYLNIGGVDQEVQLLVVTIAFGHSPDEIPGHDNLGTDGRLFYVV